MLQYAHIRNEAQYNEGTVALQTPTKKDLENIFLTHASHTLFNVGISVKSNKDSFVKKRGREVAEKNMTLTKFALKDIQQKGTSHLYHFYSSEVLHNRKKYAVLLKITTVAESDNVRLIGSYFDLKERK